MVTWTGLVVLSDFLAAFLIIVSAKPKRHGFLYCSFSMSGTGSGSAHGEAEAELVTIKYKSFMHQVIKDDIEVNY